MQTSKLTSKYQATIPIEVRKVLDLKKGDQLVFEIDQKVVRLRKVTPIDWQFLKGVESSLSEWSSKEDEEAYRDL